ncbi:hypothetical protein DFH08DRAFT_812337 [Mycena albidolilacea]|uniref:Uncharacterized protein n=1 Tax=Mycena albidolilacea TaxID=1033008 RepID=A0AAD7EMI2_9AGAR|nr:hypothetical protein DFH08DRAFT_812337 [Mycena albidolilacea]
MGRTPKHFTAADRNAADTEARRRYNDSMRGKDAIAARKAVAGNRRKGAKTTTTTPSPLRLPPLSEDIERLGATALPGTCHLYQAALSGAVGPDFADIERWRTQPPFAHYYNEPPSNASLPWWPDSSFQYYLHTRSLRSVLDGVRMREQRTRDVERRLEFKRIGSEAALGALRAEVLGLLDDFKQVKAVDYHPYIWAREYAMWENYIAWQARTICHLYYLKFLETS